MDARIVKTRAALRDALLDLARERSLDDITVVDITDRAGVNRASFYLHYPDKESLLADALEAELHAPEISELSGWDPKDGAPPILLHYLGHVREHADLYRRVLTEAGSGMVANRVRQHVLEIVHSSLEPPHPIPFTGLPRDVAAAGVAGAAVGVITAWLERSPRPSIEVLAQWLWDMLFPAGTSCNKPHSGSPEIS